MAKKTTKELPKTTAAQLGSIIKSCRDIMRKDKGLNGDLDRLPMITWIMFLKFLDDMEQIRETESEIKNEKYSAPIRPPYRWRDWAAKEGGITGDDLIHLSTMMNVCAQMGRGDLGFLLICARLRDQGKKGTGGM